MSEKTTKVLIALAIVVIAVLFGILGFVIKGGIQSLDQHQQVIDLAGFQQPVQIKVFENNQGPVILMGGVGQELKIQKDGFYHLPESDESHLLLISKTPIKNFTFSNGDTITVTIFY